MYVVCGYWEPGYCEGDEVCISGGDHGSMPVKKGRRIEVKNEALELLCRDYLLAIQNGELPIDQAIAIAQDLMRTNFALYAEQGWPQIYECLLAAKAERDRPGLASVW